jgi:hypothetical protein
MVFTMVPRKDQSGLVRVDATWEEEYFESRKIIENITESLLLASQYTWRQIMFKLGVLSRGQHHLSFQLEFV